MQAIIDQRAEIDDALPATRGGKITLGGLRIEVVSEQVADAREEFEQHDAEVGFIEIRPTVGQLRNARHQFLTDGVVVLINIGKARAACAHACSR